MSSQDDLTSIFKLIESSEQIIEEKKKRLADVKQQTEACREKFRNVQQQNDGYSQNIEDLNLEYSILEQKLKDLERHCGLMEDQKLRLCQTVEQSNNKLSSIEKQIDDITKDFREASSEFLKKYDAGGKWLAKRKAEAREMLSKVMSQITEANGDIEHLEEKNRERIADKQKLEELRKLFQNKVEDTERLVQLKIVLSNFPDNDVHCKHLSDELKAIREKNMKGQCQDLTEELKCLEDQHDFLTTSLS